MAVAVGRIGGQDPREEACSGVAGDLAYQQRHADAQHHVGRQKHQVVGQDVIAEGELDRPGECGGAEARLREEERHLKRVGHVAVPEVAGIGDDLVLRPAKDPDLVERVTEVLHHSGRVTWQRPGHDDGQRDEHE